MLYNLSLMSVKPLNNEKCFYGKLSNVGVYY